MIARWFWREWRSPSLIIVWLALTLSVACVLALGSMSDRMQKGLGQQSREFLAADRVLRAPRPVDEAWLRQAQGDGLLLSRQISFMTMTFAGDNAQLADVKATDARYPLYGVLTTRPANLRAAPGTVLVAPRLLALLGVKVGDPLEVGNATLRIAGEVVREPDSGFNPFQTAPGIIINLADVPSTGAVQPGGRVTWRYLFAGAEQPLQNFEQFLLPKLADDQRWYSMDDSSGALNSTLQRAHDFLVLSALLTLLLSVAAVAVAMGHYCRSRGDVVAILKTLGAGRRSLMKLVVGQWLALLIFSGVCGGLIGLSFEAILLRVLAPVLPVALPAASGWPWLWSLGSLVVISLLVGLRPYRQLLATRPLRVLRRDTGRIVWPLRIYLPVVALMVLGLLTLLAGANALLWSLVGGIVMLSLLLAVIGWGALWILRRLTVRRLTLRLAINRLLRQPLVTMSQLAAFSMSFMLLALLLVMRGDLLERWQQQLPPDSPNYFLLNMTTEQVPQVKDFLAGKSVQPGVFYPIIRARLTEINQQKATEVIHENDPGGRTVNRELNLTWLSELPEHNQMLNGQWPPKTGEVSIEQQVAEQLHLKPGDMLTFTGDTQSFSAKVSSVRKVDWQSLRPNFFFIFPPGVLDHQPQTWLTSFRYHGDGKVMVQLNRQFPTLSLLDVGAILDQIGQILRQVSRALEIMVILVLICGGLLLAAQVQVGMRQRQQELVVYRTLGAGRTLLRATLWSEFALLGGVAGLAATVGAEVALALLQRRVFDFPWQPNYMLWWMLPLGSMLLLSLMGTLLGIRLITAKGAYRQYQG
ncbi:putative ABC transporter permease subunit YbbP [Acerihabitans sp. TG2]|uniref:putative ABC transporter permease subunit YbbP n=1 Tax=Acerihabitans sp. TG2 TaxID=3096008 RepID=UPI002B2331C3|nr:putative ABC transporter permease subunit YbbP [Acerihabitans sp. TG2]MEA9390847.1 putative ABC transporter permease subunit YbbP [Acerihabitans sp. TG2]